MNAPKQPRNQAGASSAKPISMYDQMIAAISLIEVAMRSLKADEIGSHERVALRAAVKRLWLVHDRLEELEISDSNGDDEEDD